MKSLAFVAPALHAFPAVIRTLAMERSTPKFENYSTTGAAFCCGFFFAATLCWTGAESYGLPHIFFVLADNYKRKAPVYSRGGLVTHDKNPNWHKANYGFMTILGLGLFFLLFFVLNIFRTR
jgi:hypothetical protein